MTGATRRLLPDIYRLQVFVIGVSANGAYTHRITIDNVFDGLICNCQGAENNLFI